MKIKIFEIIKTDFAVTTDNGNKIFKLIDENLSLGHSVEIDFSEIKTMTTAFLNSAVGQLYSREKYNSTFLNKHISLIGFKDSHLSLIKMVIERAKEYFEDKDSFEKNLNESINGDN
ncbi:STAS-like domain-containing protein [Tenacibaculum finnmarkense genomovar finnmarkense]|uniref:STAS-like domain-containing protein n=1 Tax=Tenacibaculum finnmarkense TaxID=2781243 RepID=UPI001E2F4186|nr:STAS-like domain-containing protein [Tenacibaculum finnmarkense]MCD8417977.1 STAS-like domain-containing protein [Tenacibaculum finnmarkense genomovar finnmarkense]MCD8422173.1 STAS-like domain-containing protein [Tenacibaculum finnmarkense genomovar ulcerans]MCD8452885.1 STAS-like domain-containing protein [Tenacibaculum finnmarkense genomovar ulcerans]MCG8186364.1 STAS-like domain-containing protein [Tenacibaculum finnmarkense genomovar finnmarkense]MCG8202905.1 STAS-like domain-containin